MAKFLSEALRMSMLGSFRQNMFIFPSKIHVVPAVFALNQSDELKIYQYSANIYIIYIPHRFVSTPTVDRSL